MSMKGNIFGAGQQGPEPSLQFSEEGEGSISNRFGPNPTRFAKTSLLLHLLLVSCPLVGVLVGKGRYASQLGTIPRTPRLGNC
jgi:hypothetical protein